MIPRCTWLTKKKKHVLFQSKNIGVNGYVVHLLDEIFIVPIQRENVFNCTQYEWYWKFNVFSFYKTVDFNRINFLREFEKLLFVIHPINARTYLTKDIIL